MNNDQVVIGQTYWAKVSGRSAKVTIQAINEDGTFKALNTNTNRGTIIKSAAKLDEIIEGKSIHADRKLKQQKLHKAAKSAITSSHNKIKQKETALKKTIADYLKIKESDIKAIVTTPEYNYEIDLKNGTLYEVTFEELQELKQRDNSNKKNLVKKETKKKVKKETTRQPLYIKPKIKSQVKSIRLGTKQHIVAKLLINGATTQDIMQATGWKKVAAKSVLHEDMHRRKGYGIKQDGDKYYLIFPDGITDLVVSGV